MTVSKGSSKHFLYLLLLLTSFAAFPFFLPRAHAQDEGWRILRADYGYRESRNDVTGLLRDLIARGGFNGRIAVNNQTMGGDPAPGRDKTLRILARNRRGEEREFEYREGGAFDVSFFAVRDDHDRRDDWDDRSPGPGPADREGELFILRGFYGVQGRMANVTDLLRSMTRERMLSLNVNNATLGSDPAPGADKILIVIYRFRGQESATAVREGNRLTIP